MLSQSSFDDQALAESFYGELFNRFYNSCNSSLQLLLYGCSFGIAPNQNGLTTFFIVAPTLDIAEQLIQSIDSIIKPVVRLMPGVEQTAICFVPDESQVDNSADRKNSKQHTYNFMIGKFFPNIIID
jgi:hypothetical protein